jgi:hypothetical protein
MPLFTPADRSVPGTGFATPIDDCPVVPPESAIREACESVGCTADVDHDRNVPEMDLLTPLTLRGITFRKQWSSSSDAGSKEAPSRGGDVTVTRREASSMSRDCDPRPLRQTLRGHPAGA